MSDYTYILYLTISHINNENEILFLGASEDPFDLYIILLSKQTI